MREPFSVQTPAESPYGVLLAFSTASAGVRKVSTDSTGPKISSRAMRWAWVTPVKMVGANQKPWSGRSQGGDQRSAPSSPPMSDSVRIRSSCAAELIAPMSVFLSSGSPTRSRGRVGAAQGPDHGHHAAVVLEVVVGVGDVVLAGVHVLGRYGHPAVDRLQ